MRNEMEYARDLHKDNEHLRTEICVMHERLRRLEPNASHIYGSYTSSISQSGQAGQPSSHHHHHQGPVNGGHAHQQQQQQHPPHGGPYSGSMQGVEYSLPTRASHDYR